MLRSPPPRNGAEKATGVLQRDVAALIQEGELSKNLIHFVPDTLMGLTDIHIRNEFHLDHGGALGADGTDLFDVLDTSQFPFQRQCDEILHVFRRRPFVRCLYQNDGDGDVRIRFPGKR